MRYGLFSDSELTVLLKASDEKAFREIYLRYWKEIFVVAYRKTGNRELAEELTQNIYLDLWRKRESVTIKEMRHYLFTAVKYAVINHIKSQMVQQKYMDQMQTALDRDSVSSDQLLLVHDLEEAIQKGVSLLPHKTKEVFRLSRIENQTVKEIARQLNITEKAVEYHITRSLKTMRYYLKDYLTIFLIYWFF